LLSRERDDRPSRRLERHPVSGGNSMELWHVVVSPWRAALNFVLIYAARFVPSLRVKRLMYRLTGMRVERGASVGLMAMFDIFFPHLITIGEDALIGYNCTVLAHEFLVDEWRTGRVHIGRRAMIGANTTVLPGVTIGDGAVVSSCSLVNRDVPAGAFVGGIPAKPLGGDAGRRG